MVPLLTEEEEEEDEEAYAVGKRREAMLILYGRYGPTMDAVTRRRRPRSRRRWKSSAVKIRQPRLCGGTRVRKATVVVEVCVARGGRVVSLVLYFLIISISRRVVWG